MANKFHKVCVIGVGLIGGSMALAMRKRHLADEIIGVGRSIENLKTAQKLGAITSWAQNVEDAVQGAELVIFAVPIRSMPGLMKKASGNFMRGAIITDVGSVKFNLIKSIEPLVPSGVNFVPAHPIAGREKSGARYSDPELFKNRWTIITKSKRSSPESIRRIKNLWKALGSKVELMDAKAHDRILAGISHLPHIVAYALVGALLDMDRKTPMLRFSAGGFKDFTRIAESSPEMWADICLENKREIIRAINKYEAQMQRLKKWLEDENGDALKNFFAMCKDVKEKIAKGNG